MQELQQNLIWSAREVKARIGKDPGVRPVLVVEPVLLDVRASIRVLADAVVGRWQIIEVVQPVQEAHLVEPSRPRAPVGADEVEDVAARDLRDPSRVVIRPLERIEHLHHIVIKLVVHDMRVAALAAAHAQATMPSPVVVDS